MSRTLLSQYQRQNLKDLIDHLKKDYYDIISVNCTHIHNIAHGMSDNPSAGEDTQYVALCAELATDIRNDIHMSEVIITPYAYELHEKISTHHDCTNCTGTCHLNHNLQLRGVHAVHQKVKEQLRRVGEISRAEQSDEPALQVKVLRNEISCLDTILTELLFLEEAILIPKILEAQTAIHASR
jgi:hypothetical protein